MNTDQDIPPLPAAAIVAVSHGRFIEAIRIVRESEPGVGLKEAKDRVEAHVGRDPVLKAQLDAQRAAARGRLIRWVLTIDLLIAAVLLWYFFGR